MYVSTTISLIRCFFFTYMSLGIYILCCIFPNFALGQLILADQTYQSNVGLGDWNNPNSWQVWQGGAWEAATVSPNRNNDVFIHKDQEIRLTGNEEVRSLYLFSALSPGRKLNLQTFDLDVYGSLNAFETSGGELILNTSTSLLTNWIYPDTGSIVFKGVSRTVVDRDSWSGQNGNSSYIVRFNPELGETLTVNSVFKASQFIIESGAVFQTLNQNGLPASSTFSFNTHSSFGNGPYGSLIIRSGAKLISWASKEFKQIIRRSDTRPAAEFILEEGAILELWGDEPIIDAASVILDGEVRYLSDQPTQQFLSHTFANSQPITTYHDLHLEGTALRPMPAILEVSGDFSVTGGKLQNNSTTLYLIGSQDQLVDLSDLPVSHLEINKSVGLLTFNQDLRLTGDFIMREGMVNFNNQSLYINTSLTANYTYIDGSWANLAEVTLVHLPPNLTGSNATFPFFDSFAGENRTLRILGSLSDQTGSLNIQHIELPGVNWEAGLTDLDDETIYYHLNSHFKVTTINPSTDPLDIQLLAGDMVLVDTADLRISGYRENAPGSHVPAALQESQLWANRSASFTELNSRTLTLASTGEFSILPLVWKSYGAKFLDNKVLISWKVKAEAGTSFFISRSMGPGMPFSLIGTVESYKNPTEFHTYGFTDDFWSDQASEWVYYKIHSEINGVLVSESSVFRLNRPNFSGEGIRIFPNPYMGGNLTFHLPAKKWKDEVMVQVIDGKGAVCLQINMPSYSEVHQLEDKLKELPRGLYIIRLIHREGSQQVKWLRE